MAETVGVSVSGKTIAVPVDRLRDLVRWMRFLESPYSARTRIDRALAANAAVVRFDRYEKAVCLAVLNDWLILGGHDEMGPALRDVRDELERELSPS